MVSALNLEAATHRILMHPIDLVTMQRRKRGFPFVSENYLNDLRKKDLLLLKDVFFAVTHLGRGGSVPGWDLVSKLNEQINELWEFRMDWFLVGPGLVSLES